MEMPKRLGNIQQKKSHFYHISITKKTFIFQIELTQYATQTLGDIGLNETNRRNTFEIHEKDGPPTRTIQPEVTKKN